MSRPFRFSPVESTDCCRILTWNVHGNYLYYLSHINHEIFVVKSERGSSGYGGVGTSFPFGANVRDVHETDVRDLEIDLIIFQSRTHYLEDQQWLLSEAQRRLPKIYIEHDPPQQHPTNSRHHVQDDDVLVAHVTPFNAMMWDNGSTPTAVVEHGVTIPSGVRYTGEIERGIVVINDLGSRGRRLGADIFEQLRREIPLDLVGMNTESMGGLGEVPPMELARFAARYRFFLNPIRWTSLGLAVCEAMMLGMPILGLATTEMVTVVENGVSGRLVTSPGELVPAARQLLDDPALAAKQGAAARQTATRRFGIERFVRDWEALIARVVAPDRARKPAEVVPA